MRLEKITDLVVGRVSLGMREGAEDRIDSRNSFPRRKWCIARRVLQGGGPLGRHSGEEVFWLFPSSAIVCDKISFLFAPGGESFRDFGRSVGAVLHQVVDD